jgi:hypothetical protein
LVTAVRPETAAEAEKEGGGELEEEEELPASQGASEADALKTATTEEFPISKLSTSTFRPNSAGLVPAGLRHPCATPPGSKPKAGPGKPAPQGQVSGSWDLGSENEEQVCEE